MTVIRGLSTGNLVLNGGGGPEGGMVTLVTGRSTGGTRTNCCEGDDAFAAPGAYTVIVRGVGGGTGVAVIGVYKVN